MTTTLKLQNIGAHQNVFTLFTGEAVLFSYETPVVRLTDGNYLVTRTKYSRTTSKHISQCVQPGRCLVDHVPQETIDAFLQQ